MPAEIISGSLEQRRDAISRDYRISFSMGPIAIGDVSAGIYVRCWRVQAVHDPVAEVGFVVLARENDDQTGWEPQQLLFTFSGLPIKEIDLAFDQNGNIVVSADRLTGPEGASEIWLYWFNPVAGSFIFERMAAGKTPRLLLDAPEDPNGSDLLLFYLNDTNQRVEYRTQRDLYETAELVPVDKWYNLETGANVLQSDTTNSFLEEVARSKDLRLHVIMSVWNPITGRFQLLLTETAPYPYWPKDEVLPEGTLDLAELIQTIIPQDNHLDSIAAEGLLDEFVTLDLLMRITPGFEDASDWVGQVGTEDVTATGELNEFSAQDLIINHSVPPEGVSAEGTVDVLDLVLSVIAMPAQDPEPVAPTGQLDSFSTVSV